MRSHVGPTTFRRSFQTTVRRTFLKNAAGAAMAAAFPAVNFAQAPARRTFAPQSGAWRTFHVTTRVDIIKPQGVTRVWLPIPSVNSDYQRSQGNSFSRRQVWSRRLQPPRARGLTKIPWPLSRTPACACC